MSELVAEGLTVVVGGRQLLAPTGLTLNPGELTVILGANGAGKSTLLKALLGINNPMGNVSMDGQRLASMHPRERARCLAYLPQGQAHAWPLRVEDVVALGRYPHGAGRRGEAGSGAAILGQVIKRMGLGDLRNRSVLALSGGEQMRVSLARALAVEARFLLADEPLASLDPHFQFQILDCLAETARAGTGVVLVLHDLRLAARYGQRVLLMRSGRIIADGTAGEVLTPGNVSAAFDVASRLETIERADGAVEVALPDGAARSASTAA